MGLLKKKKSQKRKYDELQDELFNCIESFIIFIQITVSTHQHGSCAAKMSFIISLFYELLFRHNCD